MIKQLIYTDMSRRNAERRQKQGLEYNLPPSRDHVRFLYPLSYVINDLSTAMSELVDLALSRWAPSSRSANILVPNHDCWTTGTQAHFPEEATIGPDANSQRLFCISMILKRTTIRLSKTHLIILRKLLSVADWIPTHDPWRNGHNFRQGCLRLFYYVAWRLRVFNEVDNIIMADESTNAAHNRRWGSAIREWLRGMRW